MAKRHDDDEPHLTIKPRADARRTISLGSRSMAHFSLSWLFAIVGYAAIVFAAFANPAGLIAALFRAATNLIMLIAIVAAVYRSGEKRAFWLGFAIVGWSWAVIGFSPFLQEITPDFSEKLIRYFHFDLLRSQHPIHPYWEVGHAVELTIVAILGGIAARYFWRTNSAASNANLKSR